MDTMYGICSGFFGGARLKEDVAVSSLFPAVILPRRAFFFFGGGGGGGVVVVVVMVMVGVHSSRRNIAPPLYTVLLLSGDIRC